ALAVIVQPPPGLAALALPKTVNPSKSNSTYEPASAVPVNVGVLILVRLSVLDVPVSLAVDMSGVVLGVMTVSIVTVSEGESETFENASVPLATSVWAPSDRATAGVMDQKPELSAVVLPSTVAPSSN